MIELIKLDFKTFKKEILWNYYKDFKISERMPYMQLKKRITKNALNVLGLYDNKILVAYVIMSAIDVEGYYLIEYLAVIKKFRSMGYGSKLLQLLKEEYNDCKGIIAEIDRLEYGKNESENIKRKRRESYYVKNGFKTTNIAIKLYYVDYQLYILDICEEFKNENMKKLAEIEKEFYYNISIDVERKIIDKVYSYEFLI